MVKLAIFIFIAIIFSSGIGFTICPDWLKSRRAELPLCPEGNSIPENYPVGAVVVSDQGYFGRDSNFTVDFVAKTLSGAGPNIPLVLLPVSDETFEKIKSNINSLSIPAQQKARYLKSLAQIPSQSYMWQRDYFYSFINPTTGSPVLRTVVGYSRKASTDPEAVEKLVQATADCGFSMGEPLRNNFGKLVSGTYGGNIQMLPGGICALGTDGFESKKAWSDYADQFCQKGSDNRIEVPTSWLNIGHTDEIMKVVRNKTVAAPCDFSVVLASPRKATELLGRNLDRPFIKLPPAPNESPTSLLMLSRKNFHGMTELCKRFQDLKRTPGQTPTTPKAPTEPSRGVSKIYDSFFSSIAFADESTDDIGPKDCSKITNGEVLRLLQSDINFKTYNDLIQKEMDKLSQEVHKKLKKKLPQCNIDIVETPDLFLGGSGVRDNKITKLPKEMGWSILPNPTNSVSINDTLISSEPLNEAFREYLEEIYKNRGLNPEFVNTFDYSHRMGRGNLHCVTNTLHVCKPRALTGQKISSPDLN